GGHVNNNGVYTIEAGAASVTDSTLTVTFKNYVRAEGPVTVTLSNGSFINDGFAPGQTLAIASTTSNNGSAFVIKGVSDTTITLHQANVVTNEVATAATLTPLRNVRAFYGSGNAVQVITFTGAPTGGTFTLTFAGTATGPITYSNTSA